MYEYYSIHIIYIYRIYLFYNLLRIILPNCAISLCFNIFPEEFLGNVSKKNKILGRLYPARPFSWHHSFILLIEMLPCCLVTRAHATISPNRSSLRGKIAHSVTFGCWRREREKRIKGKKEVRKRCDAQIALMHLE